jgi:hypothetical protein
MMRIGILAALALAPILVVFKEILQTASESRYTKSMGQQVICKPGGASKASFPASLTRSKQARVAPTTAPGSSHARRAYRAT